MPSCPQCGRDVPDDARFCPSCGAALAPEPPREERKVVTVLFADLVGFTGRAEQLDPEDVRALLSPYYARLRGELERFGGTVEKFIGDAVMALFGAPVAHEDDPERAVRAALAIRDAIADEGELEVRVGIATGEAIVALGARPAEGEGMAAGDVVNTAARLQAAAPANGVLVGEATYRATAQVIEYRGAEPVVAKGKADPVPVWEAVEPRSRFGVDLARRVDTPLVGREDEVALLAEALQRMRRERSPRLVTLVGVPGIGKSRLVHELFQAVDADPELVYWRQGRCLPYGDGVTFWALAEMVKAHAGILDSDPAEAAEEKLARAVAADVPRDGDWVLAQLRPLAGLSTEGGGRSERREEAFAAWRRFFESLAERSPLVLVFEDLHWADDGLLDFVDYLVEWATGVPLLVLCTARPELLARRGGWGGGKANAATISLSPLTDVETARLVAELLGQAVLPQELQTALLARAEGNPLYAEEYVRMLRDRGFLRRDDGVWRLDRTTELPLPETVQGIIAARLDALGPEEKRLVQDAAVVGKVFWPGGLAALGGGERWVIEEGLHRLERRELVRRDRASSVRGETEYSFAHLLVRDVAYRQIPRGERASRHLAAAGWIESLAADRPEDHAEMLAHHFMTAFDLDATAAADEATTGRAVDALREAGDRARALVSFSAAAGFYASALELSRAEGRARADLLRRYGEARWATTSSARGAEGGIEELTEALELYLAEDCEPEAAEVEVMLAEAAFDSGDGTRAMELSRSVVERIVRLEPGPVKAYAVGWLAHRLLSTGIEPERIRELAEEAVATAAALGPSLEATALNGLGIVQAMTGDSPTGIATLERAVEVAAAASPFERARSLGNLASLVQEYGDARRARRVHEEGLALSREFALGFGIRWLEAEVLQDRYLAGEWDAALEDADAYLAVAQTDPYFMDAPVAGVRALARLARGDLAGATADAAWALQRAREALENQVLLPTLAFHARCSAELGAPAAARSSVDELLALIPDAALSPHLWFVQLAFALRELGTPERLLAIDVADTLWGRAARLLAGGRDGEAADVLHEIGSLPDEADARLLSGEPEQIERALAFYRSVGATAYAARAESLLATSRSA